jgi:long-chain acyl-CoA synthetase
MAERFQQKFDRPILQTYGLTEASPVVTANPPEQNRPGTVGPPLAGVEIRLLNEDGMVIPRGSAVAGELCVRGDLVMNGYAKNPEATARCLSADGWLRTGDLARVDEAGYVTLLGRSKDLIVRAGEKIYPEEVEEALHRHPGVAEAAVVGAPDPVFEEVPVAFIVPAGAPLDGADLRAHCLDQLAAYKVPRRFVFTDKLPRNPNGKVLKKTLREALSPQPQPLQTQMQNPAMDTETQGGPRGTSTR